MKISYLFSGKFLTSTSKLLTSAIALGLLWSCPVNAQPDYRVDLNWSANNPRSPGAYSYNYCKAIAAGSITSIYFTGDILRYGALVFLLETPRKDVINMARNAARSGDVEAAVGLAALTQCHNNESFPNMLRNADGVYEWLLNN